MGNPKTTIHHLPDWIFDSGLFYVAVADMEGKYLYVNDYFLKSFQSSDSDFENKYFTETVNPDDIEKAVTTATACVQNPEKSFSVNLRKKNENSLNTILSAWEFSLLRNCQGQHIGIFSIGYDISNNQNLIPNSCKEKTDFIKIFKNSSDGFILLNSNFELLYQNKVSEKFIGTDIQNDGVNLIDYYSRNNNSNFVQAIKKTFESAKPALFQDANGCIHFKGIVIPYEENFSIILRDNTKEQESKIKIQESENKLKAILDSTLDCIILISEDMKIMAFNKVAAESCLLMYNRVVKEGDNFEDYILDSISEEFKSNFEKALKGKYGSFEKELEIKPNEKQWFEFIFCPVFDNDQKLIGVTKILKDISESKSRLAKIEYQNTRLKEIAWRQSHEVRTPLANLMGLVNLLSVDKNELSKNQFDEFFKNILSEADKLDQVIRKISTATEELE